MAEPGASFYRAGQNVSVTEVMFLPIATQFGELPPALIALLYQNTDVVYICF